MIDPLEEMVRKPQDEKSKSVWADVFNGKTEDEAREFLKRVANAEERWQECVQQAEQHWHVLCNGFTLLTPDTFRKNKELCDLVIRDDQVRWPVPLEFSNEHNCAKATIRPLGYLDEDTVHYVTQLHIVADHACAVSLWIGGHRVREWRLGRNEEAKQNCCFLLAPSYQNVVLESRQTHWPPNASTRNSSVNTRVWLCGFQFGNKEIPNELRPFMRPDLFANRLLMNKSVYLLVSNMICRNMLQAGPYWPTYEAGTTYPCSDSLESASKFSSAEDACAYEFCEQLREQWGCKDEFYARDTGALGPCKCRRLQ